MGGGRWAGFARAVRALAVWDCPAACLPVGAVPAPPGRTLGAPPFTGDDADAGDLRPSCRAGLEDAPPPGLRPELWLRSCGAGLGAVAPAGGAAEVEAVFLLGRDGEPSGRWVLREGLPALPGWDVPPGLSPNLGTEGPPGRGARGEPEGAFAVEPPGLPPSAVTVVWAEVRLVLFTVLPPAVCVALWVERAAPVPAAPDCGLLGCLGRVDVGTVPAPPGRETPRLGVVPIEPGREPPPCWEGLVPPCFGAVCPPPEGGT